MTYFDVRVHFEQSVEAGGDGQCSGIQVELECKAAAGLQGQDKAGVFDSGRHGGVLSGAWVRDLGSI